MRSGVQDQLDQHGEVPISTKNTKISQAWWRIIPDTTPDPRDCISLIHLAFTPFPHISFFPVPHPDHTWFIDGSSTRPNRHTPAKAGYAIVSSTSIIEATTLPPSTTSQQAELIALPRALTLAKGLCVNIYTDSKYAFHILHHHAVIWAERGFITMQRSCIINKNFNLHL